MDIREIIRGFQELTTLGKVNLIKNRHTFFHNIKVLLIKNWLFFLVDTQSKIDCVNSWHPFLKLKLRSALNISRKPESFNVAKYDAWFSLYLYLYWLSLSFFQICINTSESKLLIKKGLLACSEKSFKLSKLSNEFSSISSISLLFKIRVSNSFHLLELDPTFCVQKRSRSMRNIITFG